MVPVPPLKSTDVFIIGNGPSLNNHDLNRLIGVPTFASNAIYLLFDRVQWRPDYYSCVDTAVLPDQKEEINRCIKELRKTTFFFPNQIFTHDDSLNATSVDEIIPPRRNVCYFETCTLNLEGSQSEVFSLKDDPHLVEPMTVTLTLMQLAVKLGARRLFLIGCDTEYSIPDGAVVLDKDSERVDKRIVLEDDSDPNHFDPRYFGKGRVWHTPNPELMIHHYEKSYEICLQNGIEVFNAGIGGKLDVFPRVDFDEAVAGCMRRGHK